MDRKTVYYRETYKINGKTKARWIKIPGIAVSSGGETLEIRTDDIVGPRSGPGGAIWAELPTNPNYSTYTKQG